MNRRIIARLDIKGPNLIKGIHLEGLRVIGNPQTFATQYYEQGIDELLYIDAVASLYNRNSLEQIVRYTAEHVFIPLTVGGGVRTLEDVQFLLRSGADKIAINTAAIQNPTLISDVAKRFGSQCMVLSIQAKRNGNQSWEAYTDGGREHSGKDVVEWAKQACDLGAGEILLTSVDQDGTKQGFDTELVQQISDAVSIPVIASSGMGNPQHFVDVVQKGHADAVAIGTGLHYELFSIEDVRQQAKTANIAVRTYSQEAS